METVFAKNTNFAIPTLPTDWFETVDWSTAANQPSIAVVTSPYCTDQHAEPVRPIHGPNKYKDTKP